MSASFSMLGRILQVGGRVAGSPLDVLQRARVPAQRLLGGTYRAGAFPVWIGPGKCAQKGHRPLSRRRYLLGEAIWTPEELAIFRFQDCTRCAPGWQFPTPPIRPRDYVEPEIF